MFFLFYADLSPIMAPVWFRFRWIALSPAPQSHKMCSDHLICRSTLVLWKPRLFGTLQATLKVVVWFCFLCLVKRHCRNEKERPSVDENVPSAVRLAGEDAHLEFIFYCIFSPPNIHLDTQRLFKAWNYAFRASPNSHTYSAVVVKEHF